ncbi:potassium channel [Paramuricea clavata]|nr:potassium channel [Paramuricea clavata]
MRVEQVIILWTCICLVLPLTMGLEMPFLEKNITNEDIFLRLNDVQAVTKPEEFVGYNISFTGKKEATKLTLDERCRLGRPLSVRWTNYGPYASLVRGKNRPLEGVGLTGIFPSVINDVLAQCCHINTRVVYGRYIYTLKNLEKSLSDKNSSDDMMFPVGLQSMDMDLFKELPVVPLLTAPRTTLVVPESEKQGKTLELFKTVGLAWPILVFIFLAAILSGVFIWTLDHLKNPDEFPTPFIEGVWEGFWWAVVTMTTVGYGDRAPRSILGRLFCIIWIVIGMSIIAIFTAMVTASLSASIQNNFVIHGSVMGSVDGSEEERIGTGMNADVRTFDTPTDVVQALVDTTELEIAIMDSYLLTYFHEVIKREPVRVKANKELPINYGLVLAPNSENFTKCFTKYIKNNPQDIFNSVRKNLKPLKNPTDDVSEELKASQEFLEEEAFHMILYALAGFLGAFFLLGLTWEFCISKILRNPLKQTNEEELKAKKPSENTTKKSLMQSWAQDPNLPKEAATELELVKLKSTKIRQLIQEYDDFYEKWMEKLKEVTEYGEDKWAKYGTTPNEKNGESLMLTYNGNWA